MTLLLTAETLVPLIIRRLGNGLRHTPSQNLPNPPGPEDSAVLLALGASRVHARNKRRICLILNKRSQKVLQPGDLCCPGGGISPGLDSIMAKLLRLPGSPLTRWPYWNRRRYTPQGRLIALLLATGLREGLEEMRLNPLGIRFLGLLPSQELVLFRRVIHPLVIWINGQERFYPNWEVERIVRIPLSDLQRPSHYRCFRLRMGASGSGAPEVFKDLPAYLHHTPGGTEILWGATFRIVMSFMKTVLDFVPPATTCLPVIEKTMDQQYMRR